MLAKPEQVTYVLRHYKSLCFKQYHITYSTQMRAILTEKINCIFAMVEILSQMLLPHILPCFEGFWQRFHAHPGSYLIKNLEDFIFFGSGQRAFEQFKGPDRIVDEHKEHVP